MDAEFTSLGPSRIPVGISDIEIAMRKSSYDSLRIPYAYLGRDEEKRESIFMPAVRILNWDDVVLPFGKDSASKCVPSVDQLREDVTNGVEWHWYYHGLLGIITLERMKNALVAWDSIQMQRHRREPVPESVGVFRWSDVISMEEREELAKSGSSEKTGPSGKAD